MKTYAWDPADDIKTKEDVAGILSAAIEENDTKFLISVIGDIARSKGMSKIARDLRLNREGLYESLSAKGNPSFETIMRVLDNLGYGINIYQKMAS